MEIEQQFMGYEDNGEELVLDIEVLSEPFPEVAVPIPGGCNSSCNSSSNGNVVEQPT